MAIFTRFDESSLDEVLQGKTIEKVEVVKAKGYRTIKLRLTGNVTLIINEGLIPNVMLEM